MHGGRRRHGWWSNGAVRPQQLSNTRLQRLLRSARVLESDAFGIKVAQLPSGTILKLFRRKRWLSSAAWRPYASRFVRNATALRQRGVPTVEVRAYFGCPEAGRQVVAYRPLAGEVLRERLCAAGAPEWRALAHFVAQLHQRGVYFRSLHAGNIVCLPTGGFGLIDIADLRAFAGSLGIGRQVRNLRPLLRDVDLRPLWSADAFAEFIEAYCAQTGLVGLRRVCFRRLAWRQWRRVRAHSPAGGGSASESLTGNR
jgi:hypothetical protein